MEVTPEQLKKLPFPVEGEIDYLKDYPKIRQIPEFGADLSAISDINALIRYIILMYSYKTPLMSINDYEKRMSWAGEFAGVSEEDLNADITNELIIGYVRSQKSHKWSLYTVLNDSYYNIALRLKADRTESGERTGALRKSLMETQQSIEEVLDDILNGDTDSKLRRIIVEKVEVERASDLRPEVIAQKIRDGADPLSGYSPYKKKGRPAKDK